MPRPTRPAADRRRPARFEPLERRDLPATGLPAYLSAVGFGVAGKYAAIHADAVATDAAGTTTVVGSFRGSVTFGPGAGASFATANTQDAFVARYSAGGTLLWARTFAGQATTTAAAGGGTATTTYAVGEAAAVAVDAAGNVFLAGEFTGSVNFGTAGTPAVLASPANSEAFVARLDAAGNLAWVRNAVAKGGDDMADALALDGQGGVVVAGTFEQAAGFGAAAVASAGSSDAFVARYDGAGNVLWAVASQGTAGSNAQGVGVAVDSAQHVAVTGFYGGTIGLGSGTTATQFAAAGSDDALVWELDGAGKLLWARSFGSTDYDAGGAVAFDPAGDVVVAGTFSGSVNFGTAAQPDVQAAGPIFDAFVLKLAPTGQEAWSRAYVGGNGWSKGQAVAVDPFGTIHIAGAFNGAIDFDPGAGADTLTNVGSTDAFVAGLDAGGNFLYAVQAGQTNFNTVLGLAVSAAGNVALAGTYSGSIAFGPIAVPAGGVADGFVARLQTQPTAVPSPPALEAGSMTGANNVTSVTAPIFDETTADPTNVVRLLRDGAVVAQRTGSGPLADPGPVPQGAHLYSAVAVSAAGVVSPTSLAVGVTILTTPPAAPTGLGLLAADDSGAVGDGITNVRAPRVVGKAAAGATVEVLAASGAILGSTTAAGDGTFAIKLPGLADGTYPLAAVALDAANNQSPPGTPFALTILATPPAAPTALGLPAADDSGTVGDGITNVRAPHIAGKAGAGQTVQVLAASGTVLGSAVAAGDGSFSVALPALADGTYTLTAVAVDAAGNQGARSAAFALTILTAPPAAPTGLGLVAADDSGAVGDGITNVAAPRVAGKAAAGLTVQVLAAAGAVLGTAVAGGDGSFAIKLPTLAAGTYPLTAVAVDAAGNQGPRSVAFNLTIMATPAAPTGLGLLAADDSGAVGDGITNVAAPRVAGKAAAGLTVQVLSAAGAVLGSAVAAGDGSFAVKLPRLADGTYALTAVAVDAAGNQGTKGAAFGLTILTALPAAPTGLGLLAADDTGYPGDGLTNIRAPRVTGKAGAGLTVRVSSAAGVVLGSAVAAGDGTFVIKLPSLADGTYQLTAVATDAAGNASPRSTTANVAILTAAPAAPSVPALLAADDSGTVGDATTNVRAPRLTVTDGSGLLMYLLNAAGTIIGSATTSLNGMYTVAIAANLADGTYPIYAIAMNTAGTVSALSPPLGLTIATAPPARLAAPTLLAADDLGVKGDAMTSVRRPRIVGVATPGAEVDWVAANGTVVASVAASSTGAYVIQAPNGLPNGTVAVQVRQVDRVGNAGPIGPSLALTIRATTGDYFGDSKTDVAIFRPSTNTFYIWNATLGQVYARAFAIAGDVPVSGDFFGDGVGDLAVYRPSNGTFYAFDPSTGAVAAQAIGATGDVPVPGDYDGDGRTDFAVFRPSNDTFYVLPSSTGVLAARQWGAVGDIPVPGDYFGDGRTDLAVFRPSTAVFAILDPLTGATLTQNWGTVGDVPVPGDYDGDGRTDLAVFRPSNDTFYAIQSATGTVLARLWGIANDVPVVGSYFGNGRSSFAVFRPSNATFYALDPATSGVLAMQWGIAGDRPIQPPLTANFSFGTGGGTRNAIVVTRRAAAAAAPASAPVVADLVEIDAAPADAAPPAASASASAGGRGAAVDRAIADLGLERWRPA